MNVSISGDDHGNLIVRVPCHPEVVSRMRSIRGRRGKQYPDILSKEEVAALLERLKNINHRFYALPDLFRRLEGQ